MKDYLTPAGFGQDEFIEKRSRFIGSVWKCQTEAEALELIKKTNEEHREAAHNVYAYIIRENNIMRYSDNGEPQGTAGMPVLEVLRREGLTNVLCIVTRYFGGVLLGAGGLTRAYAKGAKIGVDAAGILHMREWTEMLIDAPYNLQERVKLKIEELGGMIRSTDYGASVLFDTVVPAEDTESFSKEILDLTAGKVRPAVKGETFMGVRIK